MEHGGEEFQKRSKRRRHLPKIGQFYLTDRPTDRQSLWFIGKLHFQKLVEGGTDSSPPAPQPPQFNKQTTELQVNDGYITFTACNPAHL